MLQTDEVHAPCYGEPDTETLTMPQADEAPPCYGELDTETLTMLQDNEASPPL